jgi:hypothetical protein
VCAFLVSPILPSRIKLINWQYLKTFYVSKQKIMSLPAVTVQGMKAPTGSSSEDPKSSMSVTWQRCVIWLTVFKGSLVDVGFSNNFHFGCLRKRVQLWNVFMARVWVHPLYYSAATTTGHLANESHDPLSDQADCLFHVAVSASHSN